MIHTPKLNNFYNPFGYFIMNNIISYGTFAIADWADQNGYRTEILHFGLELLFRKGFRLGRVVSEKDPLLIGIGCHWHYQAHDVSELARHLKEVAPDIPILVGGYTATLFAEELLRSQPAIDFVIRGESEGPVVGLLEALRGRMPLDRVPNLSFRRGGQIQHNPLDFTADKPFLERLKFCRLDLLSDYRTYLKRLSSPVYLRSYPAFFNYSLLSSGRLEGYVVPVGRGCPVNCQYCGGGKDAAALRFGRSHPTLISPGKVLEDIARAGAFGVNALYFPYDPYPGSDYYPRLFRMIREKGFHFQATFESFGLPTRELIREFAAAFGRGKRSQILISPESGDETLRMRCKGYPYANRQLMGTLDEIERSGATAQISYAIGLPEESTESLERTRSLWRTIRHRHRCVFLQTATIIDPDPFSPAERAGMVPTYTFKTLLETHRDSHKGSYTGWTYLPVRHACPALAGSARETYLRLRAYKCRHFCSYLTGRFKLLYPINRLLCMVMGLLFRRVGRPLRMRDFV